MIFQGILNQLKCGNLGLSKCTFMHVLLRDCKRNLSLQSISLSFLWLHLRSYRNIYPYFVEHGCWIHFVCIVSHSHKSCTVYCSVRFPEEMSNTASDWVNRSIRKQGLQSNCLKKVNGQKDQLPCWLLIGQLVVRPLVNLRNPLCSGGGFHERNKLLICFLFILFGQNKLLMNRRQIRLLNGKTTDLDWYHSRYYQKLK